MHGYNIAVPLKLTNADIDLRLENRNIKRLDDYETPGLNNRTKVRWQCTLETCGYTWQGRSHDVLDSQSGCPRCAGKEPITNEVIDRRLKEDGINIKRLEDSGGAHQKISWQCMLLDCGFIWKTTPSCILNQDKGCLKCSGMIRLTNNIIDERLVGKDIIRIGSVSEIRANKTPITFQCIKEQCKYIWDTAPSSILNAGNGCPKCSNNAPLTNEAVDFVLLQQERSIKRIGDCAGNKTNIKWRCVNSKCDYVWLASPSNVITNRSGCPRCKLRKNENIIYVILKDHNITFDIQKRIKDLANTDHKIKVDFYLPKHNIIIEYNGHQHYQPVCFGGMNKDMAQSNFLAQQVRDANLRKFCEDNHIQLLSIDGRQYYTTKLETYMIDILIPRLMKV
jgi:very-short-patch-repair endonuclease